MNPQLAAQTEAPQTAAADALLQNAAALVAGEMRAVDAALREHLQSDIAMIRTLGEYIIKGGGKRMRPLVLLLAGKICGGDARRLVLLAAVVELIHTATLLHDDVVDASAMRRGRPTANHVWGNEAGVLVGDFLYSRAFEMMVASGDMQVMRILAKTTNTIAEGEVLQLLNARSSEVSEDAYFETIRRKTAVLFESAAQLGALGDARADALAGYALHLGLAFQLVDDMIDYSTHAPSGKNAGDDLAEGKPTLPLICAMRASNKSDAGFLQAALESADASQIDKVIKIIESSGALEYTQQRAQQEASRAIDALGEIEESPHKQALIGLARFAVTREY